MQLPSRRAQKPPQKDPRQQKDNKNFSASTPVKRRSPTGWVRPRRRPRALPCPRSVGRVVLLASPPLPPKASAGVGGSWSPPHPAAPQKYFHYFLRMPLTSPCLSPVTPPGPTSPQGVYSKPPPPVNRIKTLILKHLRSELSESEQQELDTWLSADPENQALFDEINDPTRVGEALAKMEALDEESAFTRLQTATIETSPDDSHSSMPSRSKIMRYLLAAAVIAILAGAIIILIKSRPHNTPDTASAPVIKHDALPGTARAILTLSTGHQVLLDSLNQDTILTEGAAVVAGKHGILAYNPGNDAAAPVTYNTLTTPRGGTYQLTLPDGTRVWLNAASSITYPTAFTRPDRKVTITGEAYFEVAKNAAKPFIVNITGREQVTVLGTSFNINAYPDEEAIKTTLLDGSVRVHNDSAGGAGLTLLPGNQAVLIPGTPMFIATNANLARVMAWRNGLFAFSNADLPAVMRQLSRWYNVDVKYEGTIPKDKYQFNGKIGKSLTLDQVLKILTRTQVNYTIEGNVLTIRP